MKAAHIAVGVLVFLVAGALSSVGVHYYFLRGDKADLALQLAESKHVAAKRKRSLEEAEKQWEDCRSETIDLGEKRKLALKTVGHLEGQLLIADAKLTHLAAASSKLHEQRQSLYADHALVQALTEKEACLQREQDIEQLLRKGLQLVLQGTAKPRDSLTRRGEERMKYLSQGNEAGEMEKSISRKQHDEGKVKAMSLHSENEGKRKVMPDFEDFLKGRLQGKPEGLTEAQGLTTLMQYALELEEELQASTTANKLLSRDMASIKAQLHDRDAEVEELLMAMQQGF